jgi:small subunit ribosomal protein S4e
MIHEKNVLVNGKPAVDEKNSVLLFDTLGIVPLKKNYRMNLTKNGKFFLEEISEKDIEKKITKIINKKMLKGKRTQLNCIDGRNILSNEKCKINDSIVVNLKNNKIEKILPLKEKAKVIVFSGKHAGKLEKLKI